MNNTKEETNLTWKRRGGYECSTKGDSRFSALCAVMPDGRTVEQHYQCDVKGYQPGGLNWRLGKGKPPLNNKTIDLWESYLNLWRVWGGINESLIDELIEKSKTGYGGVLSDCFASSAINQARALSIVCNERVLLLKERAIINSNEDLHLEKEVNTKKKRRKIIWP